MAKNKAHTKRMRQLICDTMISLLAEKSFSKITIQDILNRAEIQRATFYRYFRDKYEVAEEINHFLANFFVHSFFTSYYRGEPSDNDELLNFCSKYKVLIQTMLFLQIENVNLVKELQDNFISEYLVYYPDSTNYEAYLAAQNFVSIVTYLTENSLSIANFNELLLSDSQICWLARYYNIPISSFSEFIEKNRIISNTIEKKSNK